METKAREVEPEKIPSVLRVPREEDMVCLLSSSQYTLHKGHLMPIIPITIQNHKVWVYVNSGATFSMVGAAEAGDMGINWQSGRTSDGRRWRRKLYSNFHS